MGAVARNEPPEYFTHDFSGTIVYFPFLVTFTVLGAVTVRRSARTLPRESVGAFRSSHMASVSNARSAFFECYRALFSLPSLLKNT